MITHLFSPKGGSGCSTTTAGLALISARFTPTTIIDLGGDIPAVLGIPQTDDRYVQVIDSLTLIQGEYDRWADPVGEIFVDHGMVADKSAVFEHRTQQGRKIMVVRPCYLALTRAVRLGIKPDAVILLEDPTRALRADDVAATIGAPVIPFPVDPLVARAVDAGILSARNFRSFDVLHDSVVGTEVAS